MLEFIMNFKNTLIRVIITVFFAHSLLGSFFNGKINEQTDFGKVTEIFAKLRGETHARFAQRSEDEKGKFGDKTIFIPDITASPKDQFLNDAYYWHQTFTRKVDNFQSVEDQENAIHSLNVLMRLNFLCLRYGVLWSHLENDAMIYAQNPNFNGVYVKSWDFPFGALFSHGGRVNLVLKNDQNYDKSWLLSELTVKSYLNPDNIENIELEQRDWSSHSLLFPE